jgi:dCTP deaminase
MLVTGFWSSETLRDRLANEKIVTPYDKDAVNACCYELSVGEEAFVTGESAKKINLKEGESISVPPGQVVLILTRETIKMPLTALGLLSIRFGLKVRGLINISGFHVDPGFEGKLVFSMYNAGVQNIQLSYGSRIFLLWLNSIDQPTTDKYHGKHDKQEHLPDDAITNLGARMPSPFTLEKDVEALRNELRNEVSKLRTILGVAVTLALGAFVASIKGCGNERQSNAAAPIAVYIGGSPTPLSSPVPSTPTSATPTAAITPSATSFLHASVSPSQSPRR